MKLSIRTLFIMLDKVSASLLKLAFAIVLVRIIDKEVYGSYRQVLMVGTVVSSLSNFGLPESVYFFLPSLAPDRRNQKLGGILSLATIIGLTFSIGLFLSAGYIANNINNPNIVNSLRLFSISPLIQVVRLTLSNAFIAMDRVAFSTAINVMSTITRFAVVIIGFSLGWTLEMVLAAFIAVEGFWTLTLAYAHFKSGAKLRFLAAEITLYRDVLSFSIPIALAYGLAVMGRYIDSYLISVFFDPASFAEYVNGAQELPFVGMLTVSIGIAILPKMVEYFRSDNLVGMCNLFEEAMRKSSLILLPIFAWTIIASKDIIFILYGPEYTKSWYPFLIYLFVLPVRISIYSSLLKAIGKTSFLIWSPIAMIITSTSLSYILLKFGGDSLLGFIGPAIGHVIAIYIEVFVTIYFIKRELKKHGYLGDIFPLKEYLAICALTGLILLVTWPLIRLVNINNISLCLQLFDLPYFTSLSQSHSLLSWLRCGLSMIIMISMYFTIGQLTGIIKNKDIKSISAIFARKRFNVLQ